MAVKGVVRSVSKSLSLPTGVAPVIVPEIGPQTDWSEAMEGVDEVVHLAARVHQIDDSNRKSKDAYFHVNIAGTARLARAAADSGVRRMVFISTIKVQGEGRERAYSEADDPAPRGPYAVSKHEAEKVLREVSRRSRLETVVLRPALVYGPGVGANFLRLIKLVERRVPLPFASVSNRRSMIFVENLVDAILAGLREPKAAGKTYLVADDESPSTPQLIKQIAEFMGIEAKLLSFPPALLRSAGILFGNKQEFDRLLGSLVADTSKIRREIGWRPKFSQREGLRATIGWYLRQKNG
jgi:nucleoside-diphosphate-sugar epimerase